MSTIWLFGIHTCLAALANPRRKSHEILITQDTQQLFSGKIGKGTKITIVNNKDIDQLVKEDIPHQGVALKADKLQSRDMSLLKNAERSLVIILDQVTDPRNIGAIMRTAAAFNVHCIIVQDKNSAHETATLAKAASGAFDIVPIIRMANITNSIKKLKELGYWVYGLECSPHSKKLEEEHNTPDKAALVLGSEGEGIRKLVKENCDTLVTINIDNVDSLNVSVAAGIAVHHFTRRANKP